MTGPRTGSRRPRRRERRPTTVALTGLLVLLALAAISVLAFRAPNGSPLASSRTVFAVVPDIGNVRRHNEVRINGVRVGQVVQRAATAGSARLELKLDGDVGPVPVDTSIMIRGRGLLGQRYVELRLGRSSQLLPDGGTIRGNDTTLTAGVPDALNTFDDQTRRALGDVVGELGNGLLSRGADLGDAIADGPRAGTDFLAFSRTLLADNGLRKLTPSLAAFAGATRPAARDLALTFDPAANALRPFSQERAAVRDALSAAPGALVAARPALDDGRRLLAATRQLAVAATRSLDPAPAALRSTSALLTAAPRPLRRAAGLLHATGQAVSPTLHLTTALRPVLRPLGRAFATATPAVGLLGRYGCDIDNFAENWRDFLSYAVPGGGKYGPLGTIRVDIIAGPESIAGGGEALKTSGALADRDPYPRPCKFSPGGSYPLTGGQP